MNSVQILHVKHLVVVGVCRDISSEGCRIESRLAKITEGDGFRVRMGVDGWQVLVRPCVSAYRRQQYGMFAHQQMLSDSR